MEFTIEIDKAILKVFKISNDTKTGINHPTIVLLHDSLGSIELWRNFPTKLSHATHCDVVVYDRQGYGHSSPFNSNKRTNTYLEIEADVLNKLLQQLQLDNVILLGHSDGGSIALIAASKYPYKIKGVITEGAHVFVEEITLDGIKKAVETYQTTDLKEKLIKYHGNKVDSVFKAWTETWLTDEFKYWNIEHFLPNIQCPCLIIQGENDEYGTVKQVDVIVNTLSGLATKYMIPHIGHTPHKEATEETLLKSVEFIKNIW